MTAIEAPDSVKAFEERLLQVAEGLPKRLRQCADYVASNQDRIAVSTVAEMAEGAACAAFGLHAVLPDHGFFRLFGNAAPVS